MTTTTTRENHTLYRSLRHTLLRTAHHHRRSSAFPGFVSDIHRSHLLTTQRQLGALRQAYRRTQEAIAWEQFKRQLDERG